MTLRCTTLRWMSECVTYERDTVTSLITYLGDKPGPFINSRSLVRSNGRRIQENVREAVSFLEMTQCKATRRFSDKATVHGSNRNRSPEKWGFEMR